jgi:hypothetical protein
MPIKIRELNIRVSVSHNQQEQGPGSAAPELPDKDEQIAECVEQAMELIRLRSER